MRALERIALALVLSATALGGVACSDDPEPVDAGSADASVGLDAIGNPDATETPDTGPGPMDADVDGGVAPDTGVVPDGGVGPQQRFSDFVKNLINTQTNGTSSPVLLPPEGSLIDSEDPAEYEDLFP